MNKRKLLKKALAGSKSFRFGDMIVLVEAFGFRLAKVSGSHHISSTRTCRRLSTSRTGRGRPSRICQIRQFLELVEQYNLELGED
jgi:hypothetical protein